MVSKAGYHVRYRSLRDLSQDHADYVMHGGFCVPSGVPPALNSDVLIRLETPDAGLFELSGLVVQHRPEGGFMVALSAPASTQRQMLDLYVLSGAFIKAMEAEPVERGGTREVLPLEIVAEEPKRESKKRKPKYVMLRFADPDAEPPEDLSADDPADEQADEALESPDSPEEVTSPNLEAPPLFQEGDESTDRGEGEDERDYDDSDSGERDPSGEEGSSRDLPRSDYMGSLRAVDQFIVYVLKFKSLLDFMDVRDEIFESARCLVPVDETAPTHLKAAIGGMAQLRVQLPGRNNFHMFASIAEIGESGVWLTLNSADPPFQKLCAFPMTLTGSQRLKRETDSDRGDVSVMRFVEKRQEADRPDMPIRWRIKRMSMEEKINLAQSGGREERMALAMDSNKAIPHYLLKNARISLEEIARMAGMPSMNPDVLLKIGDNANYTQNLTVCKNLVYNPKTPILLAVRLLDRLPRQEVINISKRSSMNQRIVMAAKKKIGTAGP